MQSPGVKCIESYLRRVFRKTLENRRKRGESNLKEKANAMHLHSKLKDFEKQGTTMTDRGYSLAMDICCAVGLGHDTEKLFRELSIKHDTQQYNTLLVAYQRQSCLSDVMRIFGEMHQSNIKPNAISYHQAIISIRKSSKGGIYGRQQSWSAVQVVYKEALQNIPKQLAPSIFIEVLSLSPTWQDSSNILRLFRESGHRPTQSIHHALLGLASDRGEIKAALAIVKTMEKKGYPKTVVTYSLLFGLILKRRLNIGVTIKLLTEMKNNNISHNEISFVMALRCCCIQPQQSVVYELARGLLSAALASNCTSSDLFYHMMKLLIMRNNFEACSDLLNTIREVLGFIKPDIIDLYETATGKDVSLVPMKVFTPTTETIKN